MQRPAVFELTRLQPSFSFSCEALVLNGKSGAVKKLESDSAEAISVSSSVLAAADGDAAAAPAAAARATEHDEENNQRIDPAKSLRAETARLLAEEGGPAAARKFESVAALMSADGFSGAGYLSNVVVRKVEAPSVSAPGVVPNPGCHGGSRPINGRPPPPSRTGVGPPLTIYLGDPGEAGQAKGMAQSPGVESVVCVTVGGGARRDLVGCIPEELLLPTGRHTRADVVAAAGRTVVKSLLDGLEIGGGRGERVDVVLACSAAVDANERVISGGTRYRLVSLQPNYIYISGEIDDNNAKGIIVEK